MLDETCTRVPHEKPFRYQEGEYTVTRGSAWSGPGCHDGCGVLMYTDKEGKLVRVEGDPDNPYNQGRLCCRCLALTEAIYDEGRLRFPMKRDPKFRGQADKWERITWDEAYDTIEREFKRFRDEYGAESVSFWKGTGRDVATWISRLAWSFGSPNLTSGINGIACYLPRVFGCISTCGNFYVGDYSQQFADRYDNPAWKRPDLIVVWGNNPVESNSDGLYGPWVTDCMHLGSKLMVIDPRYTWLADRAEYHLQIRPGTDAALAMAFINVIAEEDLYDHEFVEYWCYGFEELVERASEYTPEKVAEITWVPADKIRTAARAIAAADGCALQWGVSIDQTREALPGSQAMFSIMAITGNLERPGGMIVPPELLKYISGWGPEYLVPEQKAKMLGLEEYPFYWSGVTNASDQLILKACETGQPYVQKAAWIQTSDVLTGTGPDPVRARDALRKNEFNVGVDLFMTMTMNELCDILLPAACYPERDGIRVGDGVQHGETVNRAIDGGEIKSDMEINLEMGRRFNPEAWPWETVQEMYSFILKPDTGLTFEELQEQAPVYLPYEYYKYKTGKLRPDGQVGFNTSTGRIELWSTFYNNMGLDPMPRYVEPEPSPYSTPKIAEELPLVLITGCRSIESFHSENRRQAHLRAIKPEPLLEIHPDTAAAYGVRDGDWVWVEGVRGRAKRVVRYTPTLDRRVVATSHGWSHPEAGIERNFDVDELNINRLLDWDSVGSTGVGSNYKSSLCRIYRVTPGDDSPLTEPAFDRLTPIADIERRIASGQGALRLPETDSIAAESHVAYAQRAEGRG